MVSVLASDVVVRAAVWRQVESLVDGCDGQVLLDAATWAYDVHGIGCPRPVGLRCCWVLRCVAFRRSLFSTWHPSCRVKVPHVPTVVPHVPTAVPHMLATVACVVRMCTFCRLTPVVTGEEDFDLCLSVNMEGTLNLLEALRHLPGDHAALHLPRTSEPDYQHQEAMCACAVRTQRDPCSPS